MSGPIGDAFRVLPDYLAQHVILCACALALAVLLGLPLAVAASRAPRLRGPTLAVASLLQTIPGLALMALFYPLLLALSVLTRRAFGFGVPALGFLPALLALTLYALLPILRNTVAALTGLDPAVLEAAKGVGMTPMQQLLRVEAPLAAPVAMAGVRTAAVWTIGAATLATSVGQTSLGNYIFSGLQTEDWASVLFGCVAAAGLALVVDALLGVLERGAARRDLRRVALASGALALGAAAAFASTIGAGGATSYVIGAKNFSEQFILADLMADRLRAAGASVSMREDLGSAVAFQAVASGDVDAYVDYSGTLWTNVLGRSDHPPRARMLAELSQQLAQKYGVRVLGALGFQNAYVLAMRSDRAAQLRLRSIADLAPVAPRLTLGADLEFLQRPEWRALRAVYGLSFKAMRSYDPTLIYDAVEGGEADVISAFSSDGRILADHLATLSDPRHALPDYDAVILLSPRRAKDQRMIAALSPLLGAVNLCLMRQANLTVDRSQDKRSPQQAADSLDAAVDRHAANNGSCAD
jgi:osmoprotectant transport system permease protein